MRNAFYRICLREKLDRSWAEWFDPLTIAYEDGKTILTGRLPDQAALLGVIVKVQRLGLHLLSIVCEEDQPPTELRQSNDIHYS